MSHSLSETTRRVAMSVLGNLFFAFVALTASAAPFDITDPTPREVIVDIEASADPVIVGTSGGATFPGGVANQILGTWTSDGVTGTIAFGAANLEALYNATVPGFTVIPGSTSSTFTIDIATGHGTFNTSGDFDFDGSPPTPDSLTLGWKSDGGPYLPLGIAGTVAGYEEDSIAPGFPVFCTDLFSVFGSPGGCGSFNDGGLMVHGRSEALIPSYPYIPGSGLLNMTGMSFASTSVAAEWVGRGDVRLSEGAAPVASLGPQAMSLLVVLLTILVAGALYERRTAAALGTRLFDS